jgi:hypothetical protein
VIQERRRRLHFAQQPPGVREGRGARRPEAFDLQRLFVCDQVLGIVLDDQDERLPFAPARAGARSIEEEPEILALVRRVPLRMREAAEERRAFPRLDRDLPAFGRAASRHDRPRAVQRMYGLPDIRRRPCN